MVHPKARIVYLYYMVWAFFIPIAMSKYNHYFNTQDAKDYGMVEAVILAHMKFWLDKNKSEGSNIKDGRVWTFNSYKAFATHFDYLTEKQVRRAILKLEELGVLVSGSYNRWPGDRTKWYSIDSPEYRIDMETCPNGRSHVTEQADQMPKRAEPFAQMGRPIPDINTDNKQQIINTYTKAPKAQTVGATDHFVKLWNYKHGTAVKLTPDKERQVKARLKVFTPEEIQQAIENRSRDPWFQAEGAKFFGDWESFWRNDSKVERYLNRRLDIIEQPGDLPF